MIFSHLSFSFKIVTNISWLFSVPINAWDIKVLMMMMMMMMIMNCFVVWLTDERCLALIPARSIVRDPHHRESPTCRRQGLNMRRTWVPEFTLSWMKLCSSNNHYTTAPQFNFLLASTRILLFLFVCFLLCSVIF